MKIARIALALAAVVAALPIGAVRAQAPGVWLAGDFHVHTTYSHDVCDSPLCDGPDDEDGISTFYTWGFSPEGQMQNAEMRGLDFLPITDHNTVAQQSDPGWTGYDGPLTLVPGYENSLRGHVQMIGATHLYSGSDQTVEGAQAIADALRADGGTFQINHPGDGWDFGDAQAPGSWAARFGNALVPDSVEVWNIGPWAFQPPAISSNNNDFAVRFWERFLDAGHHVAATGGSDNHWRSTSFVQGPGQPTTWVYAADRSAASILAAVRAGRTFVSSQPPAFGGPRAFLETVNTAGETQSTVGDTVARSSSFRVRVENVPGAQVRIVGNGGATLFESAISDAASFTFSAPADVTWMRAEVYVPDAQGPRAAACPAEVNQQTTLCANRIEMLALTSAIFVA